MKCTELTPLKHRLIAEERYLKEEIEGRMAEQAHEAETAGEERDAEFIDGGAAMFEHEKVFAIEGALEDMLAEVRHALHKMESGSYGVCDDCGQPIAAERLEALPQASLCLSCKIKHEHRQLIHR